MYEIVGREEELASSGLPGSCGDAACRARDRRRGGDREVDPLARGVDDACELGFRVLSSRPAEAERGSPTRGSADLFEDVLDEVLPALPPPRRRALEAALLLADADEHDAVDPRALGLAIATRCELLGERARSSSPSTMCSGSMLRRRRRSRSRYGVSEQESACCCCSRGGATTGSPRRRSSRRSTPTASSDSTVGPLSVGALHRLSARPARQAVRAPDAAAHPRAVGRESVLRAGAGARARRGRRPARSRSQSRTRSRSSCARGSPVSPPRPTRPSRSPRRSARRRSPFSSARASRREALDPALAAHVIEREDGTIRFTHPLLSSVLYRDLGEGAAATFTGGSPRSSMTRCCAPATSRSRRTHPTPMSPRSLDERREAGGRSRRLGRRGRARRAGASAHTARTRAKNAGAGRWPRLARITRPASGRARGRSRPTCSTRPRPALARRSPHPPRRAGTSSTARPSCSRRPCARRPLARRSSRSSTVASRGRRASRIAASSTRARRSSWPTSSTTTRSGFAPAPCRRSSTGSPATPEAPPISRLAAHASRRPSAASSSCRRRRSRS